jgi:uncharacterized membrane protein
VATRYNLVAGRSVERIAALSDGVFAVAMTLLVLDLKSPAEAAIHSERALLHALWDLAPRLLIYLMSLMTLGIFWMGQQTQLNALARSNRDLSWLHLSFLGAASLMPFTTSLMAEFIQFRTALLVYWANIVVLGLLLYFAWRMAVAAALLNEGGAELGHAVERRIVSAQLLYAVGAVLCVVGTYWSIGFIVLVQLNYVLAPRIAPLNRL